MPRLLCWLCATLNMYISSRSEGLTSQPPQLLSRSKTHPIHTCTAGPTQYSCQRVWVQAWDFCRRYGWWQTGFYEVDLAWEQCPQCPFHNWSLSGWVSRERDYFEGCGSSLWKAGLCFVFLFCFCVLSVSALVCNWKMKSLCILSCLGAAACSKWVVLCSSCT